MMKDNSKIETNGDGESGDSLEVLVSLDLPDKKIKKHFFFGVHDKVWTAKLQVINDFLKGVRDALNFGFYDPPCNGKSGKFLEEERTFVDYPLFGTPPVLEFTYKKRIFRSLVFEPKTLLKINSKPNQRKLFELVCSDAVSLVAKLTEKGLDPNFQDDRTGETPLSVAVSKENAAETIMTLVNFGALLDYRTRDGLTPLHKAAVAGRAYSVKILLDLGASPNYKDSKGLTPLFYTALFGGDPYCCEILLNDHAELHTSDHQGMQEIHLACKNGLVQHLEHLLVYGAEIDARTASGNTALHVAALSNQDECVRVLLFRGAKRNILNYANQSAYQVAAVGGNKELAELIRNFTDKGIVKVSAKPTYSTRRRKSVSKPKASSLFPRTSSEPQLSVKSDSSSPPSPMSSTHSLPSTTSETTSVDEQNHSMNGDASEIHNQDESKFKRTLSVSSANSDSSYCSESDSGELSPKESRPPRQERIFRQVSAPDIREKLAVPPVKAVSGAATIRKRLYASVPGKRFVAVRDYRPSVAGELALEKGDEVEVLYVGEKGYWEGRVGNITGWFHHSCVEEKKRKGKGRPKTLFGRPVSSSALLAKSDTQDFNHVVPPADQSLTTSRVLSLKRTNAGFGFQMRGANSQVPRLNFVPTPDFPALQYIGEVEKGGEAHLKGVKHGDFILEVNGEDVTRATHGHVVELIKASGDTVTLKIVTTKNQLSNGTDQTDGKGSKLPPPPPERDLSTTQTLGRMSRLSSSRPSLYEISTGDIYEEPANYRVDSVITVSKENRWHSLQRQKPHARKPVGVQMKGQTSVKRNPSNSSNSGKAAGKRSMSLQNMMPPPYESLAGRRPLSGVVAVAIPRVPEESQLTRSVSEDNTGSLLRRTSTSKSTPNLEQSHAVRRENSHHSPQDEAERDVAYNRPFSYVAPNDFRTRAASSDDAETIVATPVKATVVAVEKSEAKAEQTARTVVATPLVHHKTTPMVQRGSSETAVISRRTEGTPLTQKEKPSVPPKPVSLSDALQEAVAARTARLNRELSGSTSPGKLSDPWDRRITAPSRFPTRKKVEPTAKVRAEVVACIEQNFAEGKGKSTSSEKPPNESKWRELDENGNRSNTAIVLGDVKRVSASVPSMNKEIGTNSDEYISASSADIYRRYTSPTKETSRQFSFESLESVHDNSINSGTIKRQFSLDSTSRTDSKLANCVPKQSPPDIAEPVNAGVPVSPKPSATERSGNMKSKPTVPPPPVPRVVYKGVPATPVIKGLITADALSSNKVKLKSADAASTEKTSTTDANESVRKMSPRDSVDSKGFSSHHSILLAKAVAERAARSSLQSRSENVSAASQIEEKALKPQTIANEKNIKKSPVLDVRGVNSRGQPSPPVAPKHRLSSPVLRQAQRNRVGDGSIDYGANSLSPSKRAIYGSRSPGERSFPFEIPPPVLSEEDKTMMLLDEVLRREAESENWSLNSWTSSDSSSEVFVPPPVWTSEQAESDQKLSKPECSSPSVESIPQASPTERRNKTVTTKKGIQITLTFEPHKEFAKEQARTSPLASLADDNDIHPVEPLKPIIDHSDKTNSPEKALSSEDGVKETDIDTDIPHPVVDLPNADNSFTLPPPPLLFTDADEPYEPLDSPPLPPPPEFCLTDLDECAGSQEDVPTATCPPESVDLGKEDTIPFTDISSIFGFPRPGGVFLEKSVLDWDCDDVCNWLDSIQMSQYKEVFKENDIRGCHLPNLTKAELRELGVKSLGHRMTLENAIARLSQPLESNC